MSKVKDIMNTRRVRWIGAILLVVVAFAAGFLLRGGKATGEAAHDHDMAAETKAKKAEVWTCSMHPQIKLPKPGQCPICFMDLIPLDTGDDDDGGLRELSVSESSAKLMEIETAPVERRFVTADVRMVGKIDYDETRVSYITAWVPGRLDRLFVDYTGVSVKKGDHMVSLYSPELLSAQEELLQAIEATKSLERSDVSIVRDTTEATIEATREKLRLWGLTPEQINEIEQSGKVSDHMTIYAPSGGIVVHKTAQEGMYVNTGTRIYTIADLSQVWVNLDAYESDLQWLKYGQTVDFTTESHPGEVFTGTIAFIHPVLNEATRTVKVRLNVPNEAGRLKPGMFVRATAHADVATGGRVMEPALAGKWIGPMHPEIVKDGPGSCDVCGMPLVRAESLGYVGAEPKAGDKPLVIPASAPLLTGKRAIVYVQKRDTEKPTYEGREIVLGPHAGDYYLVERGLAAGERVVTKGNFKLDAELQIRAKPSMMTPGGGGAAGGHAHHGKDAMEDGEMSAEEGGVSLPALARSQLQEVAVKAREAIQASSGQDLAAIRDAYGALREQVQAVDVERLQGQARRLWDEHGMLLGNDATVGAGIRDVEAARRLAATTGGHLDQMRSALGLSQTDHAASEATEIDPAFHAQLRAVVDRYLAVQSALAADDHAKAVAAAGKALDALAEVDMGLVTGEDHMDWMQHADPLKALLTALVNTEEIDAAREQFALLSEELAAALTRFGVAGETLYKAWCPMAFNNRGATWIQSKEEISNPYFGEAMLGCGEIREVLK